MPSGHTTTRRFYGSVRSGEADLGEHFCELTADPYNSREMRVTVHVSTGSGWDVRNATGGRVNLYDALGDGAFEIVGLGVSVQTQDGGVSSRSGQDGSQFTARVQSVEEVRYWAEDVKPHTYDYGYRFPLTALTYRPGRTMSHGEIGFLRGDFEENGERVTVTPEPPTTVHLDGVEIEIGSCYNFHDGGPARYPEQTLVSESTLGFRWPETALDDAPEEEARAIADAVLRLISVVERDRVRWTRENVAARSEAGDPSRQWRTTRWASPPVSKNSLAWERRSHLDALQRLVEAYDALPPTARRQVDRACTEFEIASTAATIETTLVRWHSVVDFYCARSEVARGETRRLKTKRRIIETCDAMGVDLGPLVPAEALASKSKGAFAFTDLRNQFVHDGFDVFDGRHDDLFEAVRTARAISERMLLATLGLDGPVGHVGTNDADRGLL